jgi:hypothetical protein
MRNHHALRGDRVPIYDQVARGRRREDQRRGAALLERDDRAFDKRRERQIDRAHDLGTIGRPRPRTDIRA